MKTQRITKLEVDPKRLAADVSKALGFPSNGSYSDFSCGQQQISMLFNSTGSLDEVNISQYDTAALPTAFWRELSYLPGVIEAAFDFTTLKFARLIHLFPNTVMIPHRDYLEFNKSFCRIHVPLRTDSSCCSGQGDLVFNMRMGEVWYLDATKVHSAASFSTEIRTHLLLDFAETDDLRALKASCDLDGGIPAENIVERDRMTLQDEEAIRSLANLINLDNYRDVLALLIKKYFRTQVPISRVFEWFSDIVRLNGNPALIDLFQQQRQYYLQSRAES